VLGEPRPTRLGSYDIVRRLERGGMAELYLARAVGPEGFEKLVVLKRILPYIAESPKYVRAFLDEARLVAGFDHPHIAQVYDMGTVDGSYFFTMEYVHGANVRTILRRCRRLQAKLPIEHAVLIARDIASALHYAHERRGPDGKHLAVVHRDVSPSNILVSYDGVAKLIDFGIAKAASSSLRTQTGALKGKISYMSPEQARGQPLDRRSDVFSLGIVLWEMIAGRRLYKSDNDMATIQQIIHEPPPALRTYRRDCPEALERIVARALALDPGDRLATAQALQLELEELAREHKLALSTVGLSRKLHELFSDELAAWAAAHRERATVTDLRAVPELADEQPGVAEIDDPDIGDDERDDDDEDEEASAERRAPAASSFVSYQATNVFLPEAPTTTAPSPSRTWRGAAIVLAAALGSGLSAVVVIGFGGDDPIRTPAATSDAGVEVAPASGRDRSEPAADPALADSIEIDPTLPAETSTRPPAPERARGQRARPKRRPPEAREPAEQRAPKQPDVAPEPRPPPAPFDPDAVFPPS
jgi:serine/threonine protein kinase